MSFKLGLFNFLDVKRLSSSLNLMELMGCIPAVLKEMVATISVLYFNNQRLWQSFISWVFISPYSIKWKPWIE